LITEYWARHALGVASNKGKHVGQPEVQTVAKRRR
jgi:hypothetical protein